MHGIISEPRGEHLARPAERLWKASWRRYSLHRSQAGKNGEDHRERSGEGKSREKGRCEWRHRMNWELFLLLEYEVLLGAWEEEQTGLRPGRTSFIRSGRSLDVLLLVMGIIKDKAVTGNQRLGASEIEEGNLWWETKDRGLLWMTAEQKK